MDNTEKLLKLLTAFIDVVGFDIKEVDEVKDEILTGRYDFKLTKRKKQVKARKAKKIEYSPAFEGLWMIRPDRGPNNNKQDAYRAYCQRIKDGDDPIVIHKGVERYKRWCKATDKLGTELTKQMSTFLGPSRHYLEEWKLPTVELQKLTVPREHEKIDAFAIKHGLKYPAPSGMSYPQYRELLEKELKNKADKND